MNTPFSKHTMTKPLKEYLSLADHDISDFYAQIQSKNDSILEPLSVLSRFKAYDILLPLNIILKVSLNSELLEWWNITLTKIDYNNEIFDLTEMLYQKLITPDRFTIWKSYSDYEYFQFTNSVARIESLVWETCFRYFENIYQNDTQCGICLFTSGLYQRKIEYAFYEHIDKYVFPKLFYEAQKISESVIPYRFEEALIKKTVHTFCSELGMFYYTTIDNMSNLILSYDKEHFKTLCDRDFTQMLKQAIEKTDYASFYFSHELVEHLDTLYKYSKRYQFESFSCECLNLCLPVLLQCDGQYENAALKALNCIRQVPSYYKADERILLSMYIALFTSSSDTQLRISSVLKELFNGEYQLGQIIDIFNDIKTFYIKFSKELSMRFDKNGIKQLKEINFSFYNIYEFFINDILQEKQTGFDDIDNAYWLLKNLFKNDMIILKMDELLGYIAKELNYSKKLIFVSNFCVLFSALASHLDTEARICINEVLDIISLPENDETKKISDKRELFYIYNPLQIKELSELSQRLSAAYENLPSFVAVMKFEKDVSLFIKEQLINSNKQLIGFDYKKSFII